MKNATKKAAVKKVEKNEVVKSEIANFTISDAFKRYEELRLTDKKVDTQNTIELSSIEIDKNIVSFVFQSKRCTTMNYIMRDTINALIGSNATMLENCVKAFKRKTSIKELFINCDFKIVACEVIKLHSDKDRVNIAKITCEVI